MIEVGYCRSVQIIKIFLLSIKRAKMPKSHKSTPDFGLFLSSIRAIIGHILHWIDNKKRGTL